MEDVLPLLKDLPYEDLARLCVTSSQIREICENDKIWETLYLRDYGSIDYPVISWKLEYLLKRNIFQMAEYSSYTGPKEITAPFPPGTKVLTVSYVEDYLMILTENQQLFISNQLQANSDFLTFHEQISELRGTYAVHSDNRVFEFVIRINELRFKLHQLPEAVKLFVDPQQLFYLTSENKIVVHETNWSASLPIPEFKATDIFVIYSGFYIVSGKVDNKEVVYSLKFPNRKSPDSLWTNLNLPGIISVQDGFILVKNNNLYMIWGDKLVSKTDQWIAMDDEWKHRVISKLIGSYIILEDGSVYDLSITSPKFLPAKIPIDEPMVGIAMRTFLSRSGNIYQEQSGYIPSREYLPERHEEQIRMISNPFNFRATHILVGVSRNYRNEEGFIRSIVEYLFWRNPSPIVITSKLAQLLIDSGEAEPAGQINRIITYRNRTILVSE